MEFNGLTIWQRRETRSFSSAFAACPNQIP